MSLWRFEAIGTRWEIETESPLSETVRSRVSAVIDSFDRAWSRFRADSLVSSLARDGGEVPAPTDAVVMLDAYRELSDATGGAVNPLVGESLSALGYDAAVSLVAGGPRPAPSEWTGILSWSDMRLSVRSPAQIDVGALGKGRLVDLVLAELAGVPGSVTVDAGGDIAVRGDEVRIGLEHPFDPAKAIGVVGIRDQALCASAINRRAWGDGLHHVLDARTGAPVRTWAATWAIAPDAMRADAVATALFFDGGPELAARWGAEWVRMSTAGLAERSPNCPAELFTAPGIRR
ncbi:FAD:protein FMN transferase [Microbacterium sp. AK031]|uniref:FAD:protein FMN transferase n=1 Tax=Microbacterium sp. AK031 TaxID=2723076 RepID=UPI0021676CBE|nr:FAD:protein FMN transferase [Microbacterium sp. AK031]MCS3845008.1 thiamine biosynthesis lipoprotein [Microbacterium sp. AK031]